MDCGKITYTSGNSNISVCAKTHEKIRIPMEKYFSDGVPSENNTQKQNDRKIEFFYQFAVRNSFCVGLTRTEKSRSPRLKLIFLCGYPHRKKKQTHTKKHILFPSVRLTHRKIPFIQTKNRGSVQPSSQKKEQQTFNIYLS